MVLNGIMVVVTSVSQEPPVTVHPDDRSSKETVAPFTLQFTRIQPLSQPRHGPEPPVVTGIPVSCVVAMLVGITVARVVSLVVGTSVTGITFSVASTAAGSPAPIVFDSWNGSKPAIVTRMEWAPAPSSLPVTGVTPAAVPSIETSAPEGVERMVSHPTCGPGGSVVVTIVSVCVVTGGCVASVVLSVVGSVVGRVVGSVVRSVVMTVGISVVGSGAGSSVTPLMISSVTAGPASAAVAGMIIRQITKKNANIGWGTMAYLL